MSHNHGHHNHGKRDLISEIGNLLGLGTDFGFPTKYGYGTEDQTSNSHVQTPVSVVYVTDTDTALTTATVEGPATSEYVPPAATSAHTNGAGVLPPVQQTRTRTSTEKETQRTTEVTQPVPTKTQPPSSITEVRSTNDLTSIIEASTTITSAPTAILTATAISSPVISSSVSSESVFSSVGLDQTASAASSASSATASAQPSSSGGLSGGAKAGLAIGIIVGIGLLASMVLFWLHKKRQQQQESLAQDDNEKSLPTGPPPAVNRPPMTQPTGPPVNQFSPNPDATRAAGGNPLATGALGAGVGAAAGAAAARNLTSNGGIERPYNGRAHAPPQNISAQQNPFKDPVNPFASPADAPSALPAAPNNHPPSATNTVRELVPSPVSPVSPVSLSGPQSGAPAAGLAAGVAAGAAAMAASKTANNSPTQQRMPSPEYREASGSPGFAGAGSRPQSPAGAAPYTSNVHRVQMDYIPTMSDEIELRVGQLVRLLRVYDDGWVCVPDIYLGELCTN
jgi:hypothetical protein